MPIEVRTVTAPSLGLVKMEERKRAAQGDPDETLPLKRQATVTNGVTSPTDDPTEKKTEEYQKDAILRQMKEYKRQKSQLETQVKELTDRASYHDDH
ncbi:hypothetical protein LTS18_010081, partial [Coniosporium uncinatum]